MVGFVPVWVCARREVDLVDLRAVEPYLIPRAALVRVRGRVRARARARVRARVRVRLRVRVRVRVKVRVRVST